MRVKKDVVYKDMNGFRDIAGKEFKVERELTPNEVDAEACKGNMACFNFCLRRDDFLPDFNKKLYYGKITDEDGFDLGYVMCEDEFEDDIFTIEKSNEDEFVLYSWNKETNEFYFLGEKIDYIHNPGEWHTYLNNLVTISKEMKEKNAELLEENAKLKEKINKLKKENMDLLRKSLITDDTIDSSASMAAAAATITPKTPIPDSEEIFDQINKAIIENSNMPKFNFGIDYGRGYSQMGGQR